MSVKVLIAHAKDEVTEAEKLAAPIRKAGYEVAHEGTVLVGDSVLAEASKLLAEGCPVVVCGTVRAMGTKWAKQIANAARKHHGVKLFVVQMEEDADTEAVSFDEVVAQHWQDPSIAEAGLVAALQKWFPLNQELRQSHQAHDLESRYRALALKSCDIVDLANLPEDDRHLASKELELRRLYVALRLKLEIQISDDVSDETLKALERRRLTPWGGDVTEDAEPASLVSIGERLQAARRLVVLGDPGAGKSTLLRWLATAFLLRLQQSPDWQDLPDIASLPTENLLPILIRCRDLPANTLTLDDMLSHSLRISEFEEGQCSNLKNLLKKKLSTGEALLLVDGLDEITDPGARARFAEQVERIHKAYDKAPVIVTCRIVGYREMGHRIRSGFEHLTVCDLTGPDKDEFARRWCALTERSERVEDAATELMHDIHASDRIERLTGNPMLLTTMALIKRKLGRLPQRRVDLYEKAVEVLLNWRSKVDAPLDPREALPQLEYLAHAMCTDGIQQIREDEVLALLDQCRRDYRAIHPMTQHTPNEFLALLERRTGLLTQTGLVKHQGQHVPVYEFRHLTLQEYLAGIALVRKHYRGYDKTQTLAQTIAPLAGQVRETKERWHPGKQELAVVENWREALRLCLASCGDDEVDAALLAILTPLPGESDTERPRAVQAALCLADEPNITETVAEQVLHKLSQLTLREIGDNDGSSTLSQAAYEISSSRWQPLLLEHLLAEYMQREPLKRNSPGSLYGEIADQAIAETQRRDWLVNAVQRLLVCDMTETAAIALTVMILAFQERKCDVPQLAENLCLRLQGHPAVSHAVAWALGWLSWKKQWTPNEIELNKMVTAIADPNFDPEAVRWLAIILSQHPTPQAVPALLIHLDVPPSHTRREILLALGASKVPQALDAVRSYLRHEDESTRKAALGGLAKGLLEVSAQRLLKEHFIKDIELWLDPWDVIPESRIASTAKNLDEPKETIRQRYEDLAEQFGLRLEWKEKPKHKPRRPSKKAKPRPNH